MKTKEGGEKSPGACSDPGKSYILQWLRTAVAEPQEAGDADQVKRKRGQG